MSFDGMLWCRLYTCVARADDGAALLDYCYAGDRRSRGVRGEAPV